MPIPVKFDDFRNFPLNFYKLENLNSSIFVDPIYYANDVSRNGFTICIDTFSKEAPERVREEIETKKLEIGTD